MSRLLVHASESTQDGRYYSKTLAEYDQTSLVRDRGGKDGAADDDDGMEEEGAEPEEEYAEEFEDGDEAAGPAPPDPTIRSHRDTKDKTEAQQKLEAEWGLYREGSSDSASQTTKGDREEESDTDDELDWNRRDFRVSSRA